MTLKEVADLLNCNVLSGEDDLDKIAVESVGASDLMSDVLAFGSPGMLLITGLNSPQCVRTAAVVGACGVLVVRKREVLDNTVKLAKDLGMPLLYAPTSMYKACGVLYSQRLKDARELNG
ncbi:MAG TPA: hypothetical protein DCE14_08270 [Kosmotogaceae bacterium]|nr:MAG: Uncharacterized protein XE05_0794 [Thermotogales bacterium 46_20]HAA86320.1 hypothetical protein [Kosmotogaceae bacterium]